MGRFLVANIKMTLRDRQSIFWALAFPLIFIVVFGLFDIDDPNPVDVAFIDQANTTTSLTIRSNLDGLDLIHIDQGYQTEAEARIAVEDGDLDYALIVPESLRDLDKFAMSEEPIPFTLYYDQSNIQFNQVFFSVIRQSLTDVNFALVSASPRLDLALQPVQDEEVKYFDELVVGMVGFAVMFYSVIGIGVKISGYRQQRILRRILVTPLRVRSYLGAELITYLGLAMTQTAIILAAGVFLFGAQIHGNVLWLFVIAAFANLIFLNIGFALGGKASSPSAASGMGNAVAMPMMFFSGTFFPTDSLPAFLPSLVKVLPLTPTIEALRAVGIHGEALWQTWPQLLMLAAWVVVSGLIATKSFRFN